MAKTNGLCELLGMLCAAQLTSLLPGSVVATWTASFPSALDAASAADVLVSLASPSDPPHLTHTWARTPVVKLSDPLPQPRPQKRAPDKCFTPERCHLCRTQAAVQDVPAADLFQGSAFAPLARAVSLQLVAAPSLSPPPAASGAVAAHAPPPPPNAAEEDGGSGGGSAATASLPVVLGAALGGLALLVVVAAVAYRAHKARRKTSAAAARPGERAVE